MALEGQQGRLRKAAQDGGECEEGRRMLEDLEGFKKSSKDSRNLRRTLEIFEGLRRLQRALEGFKEH
jgi:hypothetical protein